MTIAQTRNPVIGETVPLAVACVKTDGTRLDLTGATIWLTLKTDPTTQADAAATLQLENLHEAAQFVVATPATQGVVTITLTAAQTAALVAGTRYYVDVKIKDAGGSMHYPVANQTLQFDTWVTRATSEA